MGATRPHPDAAGSPAVDLPPRAEPASAAIDPARDAARAARQSTFPEQALGPHIEAVAEQVDDAHHPAHPQPPHGAHDETDAQPTDDPHYDACADQADRANGAASEQQLYVARVHAAIEQQLALPALDAEPVLEQTNDARDPTEPFAQRHAADEQQFAISTRHSQPVAEQRVAGALHHADAPRSDDDPRQRAEDLDLLALQRGPFVYAVSVQRDPICPKPQRRRQAR